MIHIFGTATGEQQFDTPTPSPPSFLSSFTCLNSRGTQYHLQLSSRFSAPTVRGRSLNRRAFPKCPYHDKTHSAKRILATQTLIKQSLRCTSHCLTLPFTVMTWPDANAPRQKDHTPQPGEKDARVFSRARSTQRGMRGLRVRGRGRGGMER